MLAKKAPADHCDGGTGACRATPRFLREAADLDCEVKSLDSQISWQLLHMLEYDGADEITYIHRPSEARE